MLPWVTVGKEEGISKKQVYIYVINLSCISINSNTRLQGIPFKWFWTFKRITIELILLNPTKFEQIRKFKNFRMKKKD